MYKTFLFIIFLITSFTLQAVERYYELRIQQVHKNITGVDVHHALAINGSIPAPTLYFKNGDHAVIKVINELDEPTSLHWHGLLVPWRQDGPQFANSKTIGPKSEFTFSFPIRQTGTYWYHSHTKLQEQQGLYGAIVIEEDQPQVKVDHDLVLVLSDWTNEHPMKVLANLKKDGEYYRFKKNSLYSLLGAIRHGAVWDYLKGEWSRMGPMDLSDVGYDAFLVNGKQKVENHQITHGQKVRLRIINAAASSYFYINIGKLRHFKVVSKDGINIKPVSVNELMLAVAETYDVIFEMPHEEKSFEVRATSQDITGSSSYILGHGPLEQVPDKVRPNPYRMEHDGHGDHGGGHDEPGGDEPGGDEPGGDEPGGDEPGGGHDHLFRMAESDLLDRLMLEDPTNPGDLPATHRLTYKMIKSPTSTEFDPALTRAQVIDLELSGDMERYTWYINGKPFSEEKYINIRENEVITFRFINKTMMHHPMHLHGHFFRVLLGQGKFAPLFHTIDIAPMATVSIEFHANEPGIWFLHCHNLYHMKMGMARLVKYEGIEQPPELAEDERRWGHHMTHDDSPFYRGTLEMNSLLTKLELGMRRGRYEVEMEIEADRYNFNEIEAELTMRRYLNQYLSVGGTLMYEDEKLYAALTAVYTMPGNVEVTGYLRSDGKMIVRLFKSIPISARWSIDLSPEMSYRNNMTWSFDTTLSYNINQRLSLGVTYRREEDGENRIGIGFRWHF